jgi:MFS family permease
VSNARRDLWLLAGGQAICVAGAAAALVALLLRLRPNGSGWVAALLAAELVPFIVCAPLSGRVVDRFETRRVLVTALAGQAAVALPLAVLVTPWSTVALFAALNALSTLVRPATAALVPAIVGPADAPRGYARLATGAGLGYLVGPALGGLVTGSLGASTALLLDAATFALLAAAVGLVRARRTPAGRTADRSGKHRTWSGFGLLWRSPVLRAALLISAVATGCAVVDNVAAPFRFIDQLGADDLGYGLYLTVWGAGALLGVQLVPRLPDRRHPAALAIGNLLMGIGIAGIGIAPTVVLAQVASAVGGIGNGLVNVTENALIARYTPADRHGQAFAAAGAVMQTAIGVGTAVAAPLVATAGAGHAMTIAGGLAAAAALLGLAYTSTAHPSETEIEAQVTRGGNSIAGRRTH